MANKATTAHGQHGVGWSRKSARENDVDVHRGGAGLGARRGVEVDNVKRSVRKPNPLLLPLLVVVVIVRVGLTFTPPHYWARG